MTRKAGTTSAQTKQSLLDAAVEEFSQTSFSHTSLRRICARAGVTTGALYFFFDSKDDLFAKCIEPLTSAVLKTLDERLQNAPDCRIDSDFPAGKRRMVTEDIVDVCLAHRRESQVIGNNRDHPAVIAYEKKLRERLVSYERKIIDGCYADRGIGVFSETTIDWLADLQVAAINQSVAHGLSPDESHRQIRILVHFLRAGLKSLIDMEADDLADV